MKEENGMPYLVHPRPSSCTRRDLLRTGLFGLGISPVLPTFFERSNAVLAQESIGGAPAHQRILVVVELTGGIDGLNVVVPIENDHYYRARPTLAIPKNEARRVSDDFGFHPRAEGFERLFKDGRMAVVHGCGYPCSSLSHFSSLEYWHTAVPHGSEPRGWLGRFADEWRADAPKRFIVNVGTLESPALRSRLHTAMLFSAPQRFAGQATDAGLQVDLGRVAGLIEDGFPARIYYASAGGWDTHGNQALTHHSLLMNAVDALRAFLDDMARIGRADDVAVMVFSEFGRQVEENISGGTDHGTAGPMYVLGKPVKGGWYGNFPSLSDLDDNGNLKVTTDFRRVYATVMSEWMGFDRAAEILEGTFPGLGMFAPAS
jgi:uncharacterized protein (DUF1501 family)